MNIKTLSHAKLEEELQHFLRFRRKCNRILRQGDTDDYERSLQKENHEYCTVMIRRIRAEQKRRDR